MRLYPSVIISYCNWPKWIPSPVAVPLARPVIFCEFIDTEPVGAAIALSVTLVGWKFESMYPFVAPSVELVGVARLVIFCELKETDAVGAAMRFKATAVW